MTDIANPPALRGKVYGDGYDGRYRLWTVDEAPFDFFPSYREGGPCTVTHLGWNKSVMISYSDPACSSPIDRPELRIFRFDGDALVYHPLSGTKWESEREATRAAYEAGVIAFMVYVKSEAKYGIAIPSA